MRKAASSLLVLQILLVVTGGLVRLTGSGLGCPTWPKCTTDSYRPVESQPQLHAWIEFGNRLLTFALFAAALITLIAIRKRRDLRIYGWLQVAGILGQGVLGGITVLTKLNPIPVAGHMLLSMILIAGATTLHYRIDHPVKNEGPDKSIARGLVFVAYLTLIAGTIVTGSGPHAGDWQAPRFHISIVLAAKIHSALVFGTLARSLWVAKKYPRSEVNWLLVVIFAQGLIGLIQWWQGLPQYLVALHMLGAALFWFTAWRTRLTFRFSK
jgi:heme a synthase